MPKDHLRSPAREPKKKHRALLKGVQLLIFDFDGVWTSNQVLVLEDGTEGVLCNRTDGLGLGMLRDSGLAMLVLSAEVNPVVSKRCEKLRIPCVQGEKDKSAALTRVLAKRKVRPEHAAYVGNDVNDLPCMRMVGVSIAVSDAWEGVADEATFVTRRAGGFGAVREVCEWFLAARNGPTGPKKRT
ncbi:MAG TPA: HAD hydrolase family protein [Phycisphaerales bacterium]|nr:HAD hydrolase family protein [Phycisphaerales bacterium]